MSNVIAEIPAADGSWFELPADGPVIWRQSRTVSGFPLAVTGAQVADIIAQASNRPGVPQQHGTAVVVADDDEGRPWASVKLHPDLPVAYLGTHRDAEYTMEDICRPFGQQTAMDAEMAYHRGLYQATRDIPQTAGQFVDSLIDSGRISAADRDVYMSRCGLPA